MLPLFLVYFVFNHCCKSVPTAIDLIILWNAGRPTLTSLRAVKENTKPSKRIQRRIHTGSRKFARRIVVAIAYIKADELNYGELSVGAEPIHVLNLPHSRPMAIAKLTTNAAACLTSHNIPAMVRSLFVLSRLRSSKKV